MPGLNINRKSNNVIKASGKDRYNDTTVIEIVRRKDWELVAKLKIKGFVNSMSISRYDQLFVALRRGVVFVW